MPSLGGALGGAATGAQIGSVAGPWGTAIGAGIGGLVGLFTGGKSKTQKQLENKIDPSLNNLMHWSGESRDKQNQLFNIATPLLQQSGKYYGGLLDPNTNNALNAALGPQRTGLNDQFQSTLNNISMFMPRGGGRNAAMANAYFNRDRQLGEQVVAARGQAAQGAMQVGNIAGSQAQSWGNLSTNQATSVLSFINGQLPGLQNQQQNAQAGRASTLEALGPMLSDILSKIKPGGGGSGSPINLGGLTNGAEGII